MDQNEAANDAMLDEADQARWASNDTHISAELGSVRTTTNVPVAIACLTAGLFLGTYFTKRAPVSLIISSS